MDTPEEKGTRVAHNVQNTAARIKAEYDKFVVWLLTRRQKCRILFMNRRDAYDAKRFTRWKEE